jgi:hypothetical protein
MRLHHQAPTLACPNCGRATLHLASAAVYASAQGPTITLALRCAMADCEHTPTLELANRHGICHANWLAGTTTGPQHTPTLAALPLPTDATGALAPTHGAAVERLAAAGASPTSAIAADPVATATAAPSNLGPRVAGPGWRPRWGDPSNPPGQSSAWQPWVNTQPQCHCDLCGGAFAMGEAIYWRASRPGFEGASLHLDCYSQVTLPAPPPTL